MGYVETLCQLCGVSFAIGRHRRAGEPPEAAWDYTGSAFIEEHGKPPIPLLSSTLSKKDRLASEPPTHSLQRHGVTMTAATKAPTALFPSGTPHAGTGTVPSSNMSLDRAVSLLAATVAGASRWKR